jgi:hypothetical protein
MKQSRDGELDLAEVESSYEEAILPHYQYMWNRFSPVERETCLRVATAQRVQAEASDVLSGLKRRGLILGGAPPQLFSPLFGRFVEREGSRPSERGILQRLLRSRWARS